ncbi:MAG: hypothetical protein AAF714_12005 [Pseudomonadota bacterium]
MSVSRTALAVNNDRSPDAFDRLRQRLWAQGQLSGDEEDSGQTFIIASPERGAGVTSLTIGLADSCARGAERHVLAVIDEDVHNAFKPAGDGSRNGGDDGTISRGFGKADTMPRALFATSIEETHERRALLSRLKLRYGYIFIDGGSFHEASFLSHAKLADRRLLALDLQYARRTQLVALRRELDRMPFKFDGFVGNRYADPMPRALAQMTS